ncbi:uncharacterized protein E0L32_011366 [Thyridium curvatum]|uniref:Transcription factor SWI6 n=1 Tax=Thyridium curvatum TaxID=1093900 RepID=A0A507BHI5_9PEZI|nr:uncharacterized protein E0L32_011366 [Thyridium curvatum]TPX18973.1 hypothetical protein E0L32_011366 [Thyridium curvatum]
MAATTVTTSSFHHPHPHRQSFSGVNPAQPSASSASISSAPFDRADPHSAAMHSASQQSQPSSQQSFSMSQPSSQQAMASQAYSQFSAGGPNGSINDGSNQQHIIYSAVYSGTDVYEMEVNNVAVMRRRNDSWLNATQILKVAGVDKGKRTKILEKEIQTGEHEKVQGGYGKYQGTWINYNRAVEVCRQYGVEDLLRPLLTYDMGQDGGIAGRGDFNTPTKEQAMAAQRKRMYNANNENRANPGSGTFFRGISNTAPSVVGIISKARFDSPGARNRTSSQSQNRNGLPRAPSFNRQSSMQSMDDFPTNSQQSFASDYGHNVDSAYSTQQNTQQFNGDGTEPPRKRQRVTVTPADSFGYNPNMDMYANTFPGSPTEPNESFIYSQAGIDVHPVPQDNFGPLPPLPPLDTPDGEQKRSTLMGLFMDADSSDTSRYNVLKTLTPQELDMPIDHQRHTVLHWAATLARMPFVQALIAAGSSPFRVNAAGETALMRACIVTNSHDHSSMPELLDMLGSTIELRDAKGRTVLHHIAITSSVNGRSAASRYYLQSLLEWVVRQGSSAPSSQNAQVNGQIPSSQAPLGLARFMNEVVNVQDENGDTALIIAAKIGNRSIISQLLEVCADPTIANRQGLRPLDFGVGLEVTGGGAEGENSEADKNGIVGSSQKSRESSDDIITSITHLLNETAATFQTEMKSKQQSVDGLHASLRTTSAQLGDARRTLEAMQGKVKSQHLSRQRVMNLGRAREDEQFRLSQLQQTHGLLDVNGAAEWETEAETAALQLQSASSSATGPELPAAAVMRARVAALKARTEDTRHTEAALRAGSREVELKYRRLVALASRCGDGDVDAHIEGLVRAVESEKGELEIGRVRRFLGGVEGVVS